MSGRLKVLLVEDSEDDALLLRRELRRGGYDPELERVYTAPAMRDALDRGGWDIVISDHSMPAFSSSMALTLLHEKGYEDMPFIIVSGKIGEDAAVSAMRSGAHDYFMKDNLTRLNTAIDRELREAENRRERRRVREGLRRSEERYRTFIAQSTEGIWRAELEVPMDTTATEDEQFEHLYTHLVFAECNDAMARMYGFERAEDMVGLRLGHLIPPEVPENVEFLRGAMHGGYKVIDSESRETNRWGETKYFLNNFVGFIEDGYLVRVWGTQRDITARKIAERALREAEEKYRGIFENAVEGIYQTTVSGELVTANPAMARILGYESPEELTAVVTDAARQLYVDSKEREVLTRTLRERGIVVGYEVEMYRKDGGKVWVSVSGRTVFDENGEILGYEGTIEDVSARKRAEKALGEIREAERRRISRDLHDDVLQDLTYALQSMQLERKIHGERREEEGKQIEALRRAVGGLRDAIYDLRLESVQEQTLARSIESLVELNRHMIPERHIEFTVSEDFPTDLWGIGAAEVSRIAQEALVNVRRHSGSSRASVSLCVEGGELVLAVSDDGRGFGSGSLSGVGLSSMRERAESLGGRLEVESSEGEGTRVALKVALSKLHREARERANGAGV